MLSEKMNNGNHPPDNSYYNIVNAALQPTVIYLNNTVDMKAHDKLRDITHQIVQPVVNSCQNVDWFIVVPEKQSKKV